MFLDEHDHYRLLAVLFSAHQKLVTPYFVGGKLRSLQLWLIEFFHFESPPSAKGLTDV